MEWKRKTRTEQALREAFVDLVREKGFENLSVSDLSREAHINRGTFYSHYVDKFDLIDQYIASVIEEISSIILSSESPSIDSSELIPYTRILEAMRYVQDNHKFISALAQGAGDGKLQGKMKEIIVSLIQQQISLSDNLHLTFKGLPYDYGREMLVSSVTSVIWLWIKKDCAESPEEIAHIIEETKNFSPIDLIE